LATTAGTALPSSSFAVRADTFYIANPTGPSVAPAMPFIVRTTATTIGGVAVPVGVYITDAFIQNGTISNAKIANLAVDVAKIADLTVTAAKIANATITAAKITDATITAAKIADATITAAKITDATITGAKIADATITAAKITDATITAAKITDATITGAKIATATITGAKIATATITDANIANAAITSAKIGDAQVDTLQIAGNAVTVPVAVTGVNTTPNNNTFTTMGTATITVPAGVQVICLATISTPLSYGAFEFAFYTRILDPDGIVVVSAGTVGSFPAVSGVASKSGTYSVQTRFDRLGASGASWTTTFNLTLIGAKR
jgi:hypothetical protein